jgi:hypothetical protein
VLIYVSSLFDNLYLIKLLIWCVPVECNFVADAGTSVAKSLIRICRRKKRKKKKLSSREYVGNKQEYITKIFARPSCKSLELAATKIGVCCNLFLLFRIS